MTIEALIAEVVAGRQAAWTELCGELFPRIEAIAGASRSMGPLRSSPDHRRNATTRVLDKLARNNHAALALLGEWLAANPDKTFDDWLRIVTTRVVRDYVSAQLGGAPPEPGEANIARKRMLHTLASALPADDHSPALRPPVTDQQMAREILEYAEEHLSVEQLGALEAWLRLADFSEIGAAAGTDARGGEKLVRAALAKLRRQFSNEPA